jgi:copper(I)-binding protein
VNLQSGGYHVMLLDLAHPLAVGDHVPLTLTFAKAGSIDVVADVQPVQASDGHKR